MENEKSWLRKNPFVSELRKLLKGFRVVQVKTEVSGEMGAPPMLQKQSSAYVPTGRTIIRITLIGFRKEMPVALEAELGIVQFSGENPWDAIVHHEGLDIVEEEVFQKFVQMKIDVENKGRVLSAVSLDELKKWFGEWKKTK